MFASEGSLPCASGVIPALQRAIAEGKEETIGRKLFLRAFGDEFNVERRPDQRPLPIDSHARAEWLRETGPCSGLKQPGLADRAERVGACNFHVFQIGRWSISGASAAIAQLANLLYLRSNRICCTSVRANNPNRAAAISRVMLRGVSVEPNRAGCLLVV